MTRHFSFLYDFQPPVAWHSVVAPIPSGTLPGEFASQVAAHIQQHASEAWRWCFARHSWRSTELLLYFADGGDATRMRLHLHGSLPDIYG
jgi:hypothetical protein